MAKGSTRQLTATVSPANATNPAVTWASSDIAKATVSTSGLVTGVTAGTAAITVTTVDGGFTATCAVTVTLTLLPDPLVTVARIIGMSNSEVILDGSLPRHADGTGYDVRFNDPRGVVELGADLYVTDSANHVIRRIDSSTGEVTTLAGTAGVSGSLDGTGTAAKFTNPTGIVYDGTGALYITEGSTRIRKLNLSDSAVTTLATLTSSILNGITWNGTNLYVADWQKNQIQQVTTGGGVTAFAGSSVTYGHTDGTGTGATFSYPKDIVWDGSNFYVAEDDLVRKITSGAVVTTFAGNVSSSDAFADGTGTEAHFYLPYGIAAFGSNLVVADSADHLIRKMTTSGVVTTLAGCPPSKGYLDAAGTEARMYDAVGITSDATYIYFTDNQMVRRFDKATHTVTTLAGTAFQSSSADGTGSAARFQNPYGIVSEGSYLYVTEESEKVRKIDKSTGVTTTLADLSGGAYNDLRGITSDGTYLYIADAGQYIIHKTAIGGGAVTTLTGQAGIWGYLDGDANTALFDAPAGIVHDGTFLYVTDSNNHTIRRVDPSTGNVTTFAGTANNSGAGDSTDNGYGTAAKFDTPRGISTDNTYLYVADMGHSVIRLINKETAYVSLLAGTFNTSGDANGAGEVAEFDNPYDITYDGTAWYVVDHINNTIRKMVRIN
ncbi:MAG: Ig-like domain-containing protein [Spirochaetota bacterium]